MEDIEERQEVRTDPIERKGHKAKGNPNRTPAQIEAFEKARAKKADIAKIKREHEQAVKQQMNMELEAKKLHTKEIQSRLSKYQSESDEEEEEPVIIKKTKAKPQPKKKKIIYQEESESEDEVVI